MIVGGTMECPVTWCTGDRWEHGGDGAAPSSWLHRGEHVALGTVGVANLAREGTDAAVVYVDLDHERDCSPLDLAALAHELRAAADQLDALREVVAAANSARI